MQSRWIKKLDDLVNGSGDALEGSGDALKGSGDALKGSGDALKGSEESWVREVLSNLGFIGDVIALVLEHPLVSVLALILVLLIIETIYNAFTKRNKSNSKMTPAPDP